MKNTLVKIVGVSIILITVLADVIIEAARRITGFVAAEPMVATRVIIFLIGLAMIYPQILMPIRKMINTLEAGMREFDFLRYLKDRARRNRRALEELVKEIKIAER